MSNLFYSQQQLKVFAEDLPAAFIKSGFDIFEEPQIDYALCGFRATYIRRYLLQKPSSFNQGILTSLIHVIGLPFGSHSQKMVILSAPRNINNEPISETIRLRVHFDNNGNSHVVHGEHLHQQHPTANLNASMSSNLPFGSFENNKFNSDKSNQQPSTSSERENCYNLAGRFAEDLNKYVLHIIEAISPGLIQLPTEMKLEILKRLSVDSIIKMSQVNNEFRSIIFQHGESLWRHLCLRDFNIRIINRMVHNSWMELYRDTYIIHQMDVCRKERALPGLPERPALPPAPYRLQIGWLPEVLELPFYPRLEAPIANHNNQLQLPMELIAIRRADSLDSIIHEN